jgi:hypothetical protein
LLLVLCLLLPAVQAAERPVNEPLQLRRVQNKVVIYAGTSLVSLTETIVVEPVRTNLNESPGRTNVGQVIIRPLWFKEGDNLRLAFRTLKPRLNLSHGRIRRFALVKPDGESVTSPDVATPDCAWVLTLDFGHVVPRRVTIIMDLATGGINRNTELTYMASNDGQALQSGPTESTITELRVFPDPSLQPWKVVQGDKVVPRVNSAAVHLEREVNHVIRFGPNAE